MADKEREWVPGARSAGGDAGFDRGVDREQGQVDAIKAQNRARAEGGRTQGKLDIDEGPTREEWLTQQLTDWWRAQAEAEIERTVPKAVEYGAADLEVMGSAMLHLVPREKRSRQLGLEMALAFYSLGKCARLFGAFERGELPSEDTWFDLGVYCRMAERVRQHGEWLPTEKGK
jgi:hypothetical protein